MLQAYEGYLEQGRFIPSGPPVSIKGRCKVVVTILGELPDNTVGASDSNEDTIISDEVAVRLKAFDNLTAMIDAAVDEEMPLIVPIRLREVEL